MEHSAVPSEVAGLAGAGVPRGVRSAQVVSYLIALYYTFHVYSVPGEQANAAASVSRA